MITRRSFVAGLIAAPAIVKVQSIMPVKSLDRAWLSGIDYGASDDFTAVVLQQISRAAQIPIGYLIGKPHIKNDQLIGQIALYHRGVINMIVDSKTQVGEEVGYDDFSSVRSLSCASAQEKNDGTDVRTRQSVRRKDDA